MGERKVLNKYIPADFDPNLVPRGKKLSSKDGTVPVRMMLPFSVQCDTCNVFMYRGKKFNSKKEAVQGQKAKYLGIQRWRFHIKCTQCARPITFLTDPQHADYEMESGGTRNYEVYKDQAQTEQEISLEQQEEEELDPMKALENRVLDSQQEVAELDRLEEIKAMNLRHVQMLSKHGGLEESAKAVLDARDGPAIAPPTALENVLENGLTKEEEAMVQSIKFGGAENTIRRLTDDDEALEERRRQEMVESVLQKQQNEEQSATPPNGPILSTLIYKPIGPAVVKVKRRRNPLQGEGGAAKPIFKRPRQDETEVVETIPPSETNVIGIVASSGSTLGGLLGGYGSSDDDSD